MPTNPSLAQINIVDRLKKIFVDNPKVAMLSEGYCFTGSLLSVVFKHLGIIDQWISLKNEIVTCPENEFPAMAERLAPLLEFIYAMQAEEKKGNRTDFYKVDSQFNRYRHLLDKLFKIPADFKLAQTFSFACFFDDESLADLLTILTTKEVMIWLSSDIHSITLLQEEDDAYWYSDPNFKKGPKKEATMQELVHRLRKRFLDYFGLDWKKMPLKVVQLVDASVQNNNNNNSLPDKKELYDVYLSAIDEVDDLTTGFTQLCFAAMHDDVEYIKKLLAMGADPNCKDSEGNPPLIIAIRHGSIGAIQYLLDDKEDVAENCKKTDINLTDAADVSALIHAIDIVGDLSLVEFLLQKGASVNHITKSSGYTALLTAVRNGRKDIVEALLKSGALPNQANHDGNTALHIAVMRRNLPLVRFFMQETNADPNRKNLQGETPVHVAFDELHDPTIVDCESVELLQALCQMDNVKINAVNNKGETPLHIASQVGDVESVSYLLTLGADVFIKNEDGKRPIDICEEDEIKVMLQEAMQTSTGSFSFKDQQKVTTFGGNTNNNSATDEPSQLQKMQINSLLN